MRLLRDSVLKANYPRRSATRREALVGRHDASSAVARRRRLTPEVGLVYAASMGDSGRLIPQRDGGSLRKYRGPDDPYGNTGRTRHVHRPA